MLAKHGLDQIFLASPTTTDARIATMGELAQGYVYYVSFAGITGADLLVMPMRSWSAAHWWSNSRRRPR